jgi:O-antigen/teichoic acid export membrane protein
MKWENSLWNYHKLGLIIAFFVFFLVSPPIYKFILRYNYSAWWAAFTIGILTWGFVFLILHGYTSRKDNNEVIVDS